MMTKWNGFRNSLRTLLCVGVLSTTAGADVLESQNNPVPDGKITVADGDVDRSDWAGIPWYEEDPEDLASPVDIYRVQMAHDSQNVYVHLVTNLWDVNEAWRVGTYIDIDQDPFTGYNGGFPFPIGAEFLNEGPELYSYLGASQTEWAWEPAVEGMARDQTNMLDVELAIPRSAFEGTTAFNFIMLANNDCCDFGLPLDFYPELANFLDGEYFTYELGELTVTGDINGDGILDAADIDALTTAVRAGSIGEQYDLNLDGTVDNADRTAWVVSYKRTYFGDSNLDGQFNTSDFVFVFQAGEYEDGIDGNSTWATGDWNGDGDFSSGDFVNAFSAGGYEAGQRPSVAAVPEPASSTLMLLALMAVRGLRRLNCRAS